MINKISYNLIECSKDGIDYIYIHKNLNLNHPKPILNLYDVYTFGR